MTGAASEVPVVVEHVVAVDVAVDGGESDDDWHVDGDASMTVKIHHLDDDADAGDADDMMVDHTLHYYSNDTLVVHRSLHDDDDDANGENVADDIHWHSYDCCCCCHVLSLERVSRQVPELDHWRMMHDWVVHSHSYQPLSKH